MRKQSGRIRVIAIGFIFCLFAYSTAWSQETTLRINEFMALNSSTLADEDGDFSDWIEIYNPTGSEIDLLGWSLTDRKEEPGKWKFPRQIIAAESYLVVFASNKDRTGAGQQLHANFAISGSGEYLALIKPDGDAATEFDPAFPEQKTDISYAYVEGDYVATGSPTPGAANQLADEGLLPPPEFSVSRGFYEQPFEVEITSGLTDVKIYYTTDGSPPEPGSRTEYTAPIQVATTTLLRAVTVKSGVLTSKVTTCTYLFLDDVIHQPNDPPGYPAEWGPYAAINGTAIADYEMDPEIVQDPVYGPQMKDALLSLPALCLVTDKDNLFSHSTDSLTGGIYIYTRAPDVNPNHPSALGDGWERPVSVEFFTRDGSEEFQIDAGIRLHGGHSRRAEKSSKHSFRLVFRSKYGPGRLEYPLFGDSAASSFDALVLRAGFGNTWLHWKHAERVRTQLGRDIWAKDTQLESGHLSGHGRYVHLYINGIYWGIYNPTEYTDKAYAATYLPGDEDEFDIIKDEEDLVDGDWTDWEAMMDLAGAGLAGNTNYQLIQGKNPDGTPNPQLKAYLDVVSLIDYMIMNFYGGNWDWDHHNWVAIRNRMQPGKGFQFLSWDAEHVLEDVRANDLNENNPGCPSYLFQRLRANADFRRLFADRAQVLCFDNGVLTPEAASRRWMNRMNQIDQAIIAESARWGDYRRDVHPYRFGDPFPLYTKEHWLAERDFLLNEYFPTRTGFFISQLRQANLFPRVTAPRFAINGDLNFSNIIEKGDMLTISVTSGDIYYTLNGSDPVMGGSGSPDISESAVLYTEPLTLNQSTVVKARILSNSEWSPLTEAVFTLPSEIANLKLTEIHYHPLAENGLDDRLFEFLELMNTGTAPVDLTGMRFDGVSYGFPANTVIAPGAFFILASHEAYFAGRYGFLPDGVYEGALDNSGERITLLEAAGDTVFSVRYNDRAPWPKSPDGDGYSLVPVESFPAGSLNDPEQWRASLQINGSPGAVDEASGCGDNCTGSMPGRFALGQNVPNPFNATTRISYSLAQPDFVTLKIYNILGREVKALVNDYQESGRYTIRFDAGDLATGVYFYRLRIGGDDVKIRKMLLMR
ncbi:lamin tail domain-containing protein [bacterium]|nr:lamin tail domain-containing protein [bacterium]